MRIGALHLIVNPYWHVPSNVAIRDLIPRQLFNKPVRTFSAGCVRVEKPLALAKYVFGSKQPSAQALLDSLISQEETRTIPLPDPIPVYLLYQTAWVDEGGVLQFRNDIYGHDGRLSAALRQKAAPKRGDTYAGNLSVEAPVRLLQQPDSHREKVNPVKKLAN